MNNNKLEKLIKENSGLINGICLKYNGYFDKEDLYQEGVIGLIRAYKTFDESYNVKFSTYAYTFILGQINKFVRENKALKVNSDLIRLGRKINEYIEKHISVRKYAPSTKDIANMLGIKESKVIYALEALQSVKSLDKKINDDGKEVTLLDITEKKENIEKEQLLDLKEAFKYLSYDERKLLIKRYYKDFTQSEVANELGVNQVYVSRLEKKALSKMKNYMVS